MRSTEKPFAPGRSTHSSRSVVKAPIVVTVQDLKRFAEEFEASDETASISLYAHELSDRQQVSVFIVDKEGAEVEYIDRAVMLRIATGMLRLDRKLAGRGARLVLSLRRRTGPRRLPA